MPPHEPSYGGRALPIKEWNGHFSALLFVSEIPLRETRWKFQHIVPLHQETGFLKDKKLKRKHMQRQERTGQRELDQLRQETFQLLQQTEETLVATSRLLFHLNETLLLVRHQRVCFLHSVSSHSLHGSTPDDVEAVQEFLHALGTT